MFNSKEQFEYRYENKEDNDKIRKKYPSNLTPKRKKRKRKNK